MQHVEACAARAPRRRLQDDLCLPSLRAASGCSCALEGGRCRAAGKPRLRSAEAEWPWVQQPRPLRHPKLVLVQLPRRRERLHQVGHTGYRREDESEERVLLVPVEVFDRRCSCSGEWLHTQACTIRLHAADRGLDPALGPGRAGRESGAGFVKGTGLENRGHLQAYGLGWRRQSDARGGPGILQALFQDQRGGHVPRGQKRLD
mmetsp:Transcript_55326/g.179408  ORF Transcript_55326/g.179408 Transcript_55326/m.179408 type:complete len:204 (+) Transcript_55326:165-776(+)